MKEETLNELLAKDNNSITDEETILWIADMQNPKLFMKLNNETVYSLYKKYKEIGDKDKQRKMKVIVNTNYMNSNI